MQLRTVQAVLLRSINFLRCYIFGILHVGRKVVYTFCKSEFKQSYSVGNN